jgi:hypothetical protein
MIGDLWPLFAHFIHQSPEIVNVFKAAVHTGEADVGYFIEFFELAHDQFADSAALDLSVGAGQELFFNALNGAVDLFSADGAFAQGEIQTGAEFDGFVVDTAAIFFNDGGEADLGAFVGGEALFAAGALAPTADEGGIFRDARFNYLGVEVGAEGAAHDLF